MELIDSFGRKIDYLRISVTKNCNFRCLYCMPDADKVSENVLSLQNMLEFVKITIDSGVRKIRITGGEPLLRGDLSDFIKYIRDYSLSLVQKETQQNSKSAQGAKECVEIALTTNGFLLGKYARKLKDSGLSRVNISLDSLRKDTIMRISAKDALLHILWGIQEAQNVGLGVKLNSVILQGINDDEVVDLLEFANDSNVLIRFIEFMDNSFANKEIRGLRGSEILQIIHQKYRTHLLKDLVTATIYEIENLHRPHSTRRATFGIIAPHNDGFCKTCNRIRLTSEGVICPCLYFEDSVNVREAMQNNDRIRMKEALLAAVANKPEKNKWCDDETSPRAFYHTGG